jgi:hypothetical protein
LRHRRRYEVCADFFSQEKLLTGSAPVFSYSVAPLKDPSKILTGTRTKRGPISESEIFGAVRLAFLEALSARAGMAACRSSSDSSPEVDSTIW